MFHTCTDFFLFSFKNHKKFIFYTFTGKRERRKFLSHADCGLNTGKNDFFAFLIRSLTACHVNFNHNWMCQLEKIHESGTFFSTKTKKFCFNFRFFAHFCEFVALFWLILSNICGSSCDLIENLPKIRLKWRQKVLTTALDVNFFLTFLTLWINFLSHFHS